ncbi:MAG: hypothetical protein QXY49_00130 [Thermofilaceae archaeon]
MDELEKPHTERKRELKGTPASQGIAVGKVKVVTSPADFGKVEK